MPRLSSLCPGPREKSTRQDRHETLHLEVDEGRGKTGRVEPRGREERLGVLRLLGVERSEKSAGVLRKMGGNGRLLALRNRPPEMPAILFRQLLEEVVGVPHEDRAILEERVRSGGSRRENRARNRRDVAAVPRRATRRDEGAALLRGFDDADDAREARDDAVPNGKVPGLRFRSHRKLRDRGPRQEQRREQILLLRRVTDVDAAAEDGDGPSARVERGAVGRGVDAAGEPRHDGHAGLGERGRERPSGVETRPRRPAGSDDRDRRALGKGKTAREEDWRGIVNLAEKRGVASVRQEDDARPGLFEPPRVVTKPRVFAVFEQRLDDRAVFAGEPGGLFRGQCTDSGGRPGRKKERSEGAGGPAAPLSGPEESCKGIVQRAAQAAPLLLRPKTLKPVSIMPDLFVTCRRRPTAATLVALAAAGSIACSSSSSRNAVTWKAENAYGSQMARKGFWREALFRYEKAAALHPDNPEVQNNLGVAYESVGETSRALAAYKKALELAPQDSKIKRNYARFAEYYTSVQRASSLPAPSSSSPAMRPSPAPGAESGGKPGSAEPPLLPPAVGKVPADSSPGSPVPAPAQNPPSAPPAPTPGPAPAPPGGR